MALPLCGPARPGTQAGEDGGTLNCTGASLGSRTRLCLPGKLRESEAADAEVPAASQRGRLVQGSQPGPALMLGPAAHSPRAGPGGEPHSLTLTGTDCASFSAPPAPFPLCDCPLLRWLLLWLPSQPFPAQPLASTRSQRALLARTHRFHSGYGYGSLSHHRKAVVPPARRTSGSYTAAKRKRGASRKPASGRSACEGGSSNAGFPAVAVGATAEHTTPA